MKSLIQIATGIGIVATFALVAGAFTEPSQSPPNGNADAPVNIGSVKQVKAGELGAYILRGGFGIIGTGNNAIMEYLQLDAETTAPPSSDCSSESHLGRMMVQPNQQYVYICVNTINGPQWWHTTLSYP